MSGYKTWTPGAVITASDVQNFLQDQSVLVFANSAARSSAIPAPTQGMFAYLEDANTLSVNDGSSWLQVYPAVVPSLAGSVVVFGATAVTTSYTAVAGLDNGTIWVNGTAAVTITVPDILAVGDSLNILRNAGDTVTIAAGAGVTDWAGAGTAGTAITFKINQPYNGAQVIKVANNTYRVIGRVIP